MVALTERVQLLEERKKQIADEMDSLGSAFGIDLRESRTRGCLRLEDVYCVKRGRKYGPYGPYYYLYFHKSGGMEKRYVGKRADRLKVKREVVVRFGELEAEYKGILKLERKLRNILGLT